MGFNKDKVDYSLYLVTDSAMLPSGTSLQSQVEVALQNGVTLVQLREKECDTKTFIENAIAVQEVCRKYGVPLLINDRVDVALAIGADGVHVGQDDMPVPMVRTLLGPDKIIGLSVGYTHEVEQLAKWGEDYVDYIGIGMVFPTNTKKNPKKVPMGTRGVTRILDALEEQEASWCKSVVIGGLHPNNIPRVLLQSVSTNGNRSADGIAVVSEIMASDDAQSSTKRLRDILDEGKYIFTTGSFEITPEFCTDAIREHLALVKAHKPLVHHITNHVHKNFGANITLALGSSPIMSEEQSEFMELARIPHAALLLNTGTVPTFEVAAAALEAYNEEKRPIVFDPVGFGASEFRQKLNELLLGHGQLTCIKGNIGEILGIAGTSKVKMRGVDSDDHSASFGYVVDSAQRVAFWYRTIVVVTGERDIIVDGSKLCTFSLGKGIGIQYNQLPVYTVSAGNIPLMGAVTATGCSLGSTIASFVGAIEGNQSVYHAVISAVALYKAAGKLASDRCHGSGTFMVSLVDSLYQLSETGQVVDELVEIERFN